MKKKIARMLLHLSLVIAYRTVAQNPTWTLPPNYFNTILYPLPTSPAGSGGYGGGVSGAPHNMYKDAQGQALVFEANGSLYNKNGSLIADLKFDVNSLALSQAESIIVPDPGNCSRFYYIGSGLQDGVGKYFPVFSLIDMSQQTPGAPIGETGKVLTTNSTGGNVKNLFMFFYLM